MHLIEEVRHSNTSAPDSWWIRGLEIVAEIMGEMKPTYALAGAFFGAGLLSAGVYSPHIIMSQMKLENFHMLKAFLAASASSAIIIYIARTFTTTKLCPSAPKNLAFGPWKAYSGNVLGGALLGIGMALTGACPGTVLPQVAIGVASGRYVLTGGLLGGILYSKYQSWLSSSSFSPPQVPVLNSKGARNAAVYERMGWSEVTGVAVYVGICASVIGLVTVLFPETGKYGMIVMPAAWGGVFIGLSQAMALFLTGNTLGVSAAYERFGDIVLWSVSLPKRTPRPSFKGTVFPMGSIIGAWLFSKFITTPTPIDMNVGVMRGVLGGVLLVVGGRIAGGCTSGHGISGMAMLSVASVVSVASMFGAGILTGLVMD